MAWVLIVGLIVGIGELITKDGSGNVLGDRTIPHWFAGHRTASLDALEPDLHAEVAAAG